MTNSLSNSRGRPTRAAIYQRFSHALSELANFGGLPKPHEAQGLWDDFWHREAHHSTAIEGNTLLLNEVESLLNEGRAVGAKVLKDYMEVLGYAEAAKWVYEQALTEEGWAHEGLLAITEVRHIHNLAMGKVWEVAPHPDAYPKESPGNFRQHEILAFAAGMKPPSHPLIHSKLTGLVDYVNQVGQDIKTGTLPFAEVPEALALIHRDFEQIHPFIDGNGRTGRLVLNLVLVRLGWPPAIIFKEQRKKYLKAMDKADGGDLGPLAEILSRTVIDNMHFLIPSIAGPVRFIPLESLADDEFSLVALKQAAARGRLDAIKGPDGRYRSSKEALNIYRESRYRRADRLP